MAISSFFGEIMYKSVKTEMTIKKMIGAIADYRGKYRYIIWRETIKLVYNSLSDKEKEYVKMRLKKEGIDIEEVINDI